VPLYEYECDACGQRFEVIQQKFSDSPPETCKLCGKGPVRRLLSSPAIQFKGSGWYITDYAQKGKSDASTPAGDKKGGDTATSDTGKSDTAKSDTAKADTGSSGTADTSSSTKSDTTASSAGSSSSSTSDSKKDSKKE
jgi:putative FmdB family regulatory protein